MEWKWKDIKWGEAPGLKPVTRQSVDNHPLKPFKVYVSGGGQVKKLNSSSSVSSSSTSSTPTNADNEKFKPVSTSWGGLDPLSAALQQSDVMQTDSPAKSVPKIDPRSKKQLEFEAFDDDFEPWSAKKAAILGKYTTSEKLSIKTSYLGGTNSAQAKATLQPSSVADKVKHRLEQLDDFEEGSVNEMLNLSQQEYVTRIDELNAALSESWQQDQRVKALKIAIQCTKLLADVSVVQFYPSKFVLITDILDNFGDLVYKRILYKSEASPLAQEAAKETCRNWFFKIASIRELIPRFYVESAVLRMYKFIAEPNCSYDEYCNSLKRLCKMIRGIGDPLVALYARTYLCRIAVNTAPSCQIVFKESFSDFFLTCSQFNSLIVRTSLTAQRIDYCTYFTLYTPALDFILQCVTYKASDSVLTEILSEFKSKTTRNCHVGCYALILNSVQTSFRSRFITERANEFLAMIKNVEDSDDGVSFPKYLLLKSFGSCFIADDASLSTYDEEQKLHLLNDVWKIISKLPSASDYINCVDVWVEFVVKNFGSKEINTVLKDVIKHMQPDRAFDECCSQLISILTKIMKYLKCEFSALFSMDNFMTFLDMIQKESAKVEACKIIVNSFVKNFEDETTSDPVILSCVTQLCKTMHDSITALTLEDEKRQISNLIIEFIRKVSFHRDFEAQLSYYVDSRANFSNLEPVIAFLVYNVNTLAMETRRIVKGHHTRKTTSFVWACLAYSYITIPSLEDIILRLQLYLNSAEVALLNACLPQTDAFLKAAILLLPHVPTTIELNDGKSKPTEPFFVSYTGNLLSLLLIVPDHPDQEPLYLFNGVLNVVINYKFDFNREGKLTILLGMLHFLSSLAQESAPYHIDKVDSNDSLYGNDEKFMNVIQDLSNRVLEEILIHLKQLGEEKQFKRQSQAALELFQRIVLFGDIKKMNRLAVNLLQMAQKHINLKESYTVENLGLNGDSR